MNNQALILIDKPSGMSSNHALQRVKRLLGVKKAGHTGTLDPFATGMLPILLNSATPLARFYLCERKSYRARMRVGLQTDTGDCDGTVIAKCNIPVMDHTMIEKAWIDLKGVRLQTPPLYSAIKHEGKPLYQWAREGKIIPRTPRSIDIIDLRLLSLSKTEIEFEVLCSKGTYIRTLVEEIAEKLGTVGYCISLRRLSVGDFLEKEMISLEILAEKIKNQDFDFLLSAERGIIDFPSFEMTDEVLYRAKRGQKIEDTVAIPQGIFRFKKNDILLGVGQIDERRIITGRWL